MAAKKYKVLIIGGGTGGISVAARLKKYFSATANEGASEIGIIEPSDVHYYQPLWTLVGAGVATAEASARPMSSLIPSGVDWIRTKVVSVDPNSKSVLLTDQSVVHFDYLIVASGLVLNWEKIEGLPGHLGSEGICTIYDIQQVNRTQQMIENFKGGTAIFVMPPVPIKCAGAPQKIMYLAEQIFHRNEVREKTKVIFATAGKAMFGIPVFAEALQKIVNERGIEPLFLHKIVGVNASKREAIFEVTKADGSLVKETLSYDLLHVVPPMSAHAWIASSGLAFSEGDQKGWMAVDKKTLQHLQFPYIFGVGDVTGVPNSKTGAAIRKQAPIVVNNLLQVMAGRKPDQDYDGYSSCPLTTEFGKVMLAEFGYDGKLMPTFPLDPAIPRRSYWHLKKDLLPLLYWQGMMKGRA